MAYFIISQALSLNLAYKHRVNTLLDLARNVSKTVNTPNRNMISKYSLDVIYEKNMQFIYSMIEKEAENLVFDFLVMIPLFKEIHF